MSLQCNLQDALSYIFRTKNKTETRLVEICSFVRYLPPSLVVHGAAPAHGGGQQSHVTALSAAGRQGEGPVVAVNFPP